MCWATGPRGQAAAVSRSRRRALLGWPPFAGCHTAMHLAVSVGFLFLADWSDTLTLWFILLLILNICI